MGEASVARTDEEFENLRSKFATSSWGGRRIAPYAFTEHGVLMLSSVLNSERAINVNIQIMRIYTKMRELLMTNQEILLKLEPRPRIGFRRPGEEEQPSQEKTAAPIGRL
jgi:hypothetical protein